MVVIVSNADTLKYLQALDQNLVSKVRCCWHMTPLWLVSYFKAEQRMQFCCNLAHACMQDVQNILCKHTSISSDLF